MYGCGDRAYLRRCEAIFHPIKHRIGGSVRRGDPGSKRKPQLFIHMADDLACMLFKVLNISPSHAKMLRMVCLSYEHELLPFEKEKPKKSLVWKNQSCSRRKKVMIVSFYMAFLMILSEYASSWLLFIGTVKVT